MHKEGNPTLETRAEERAGFYDRQVTRGVLIAISAAGLLGLFALVLLANFIV